jgi:predicted P-loop ATPase
MDQNNDPGQGLDPALQALQDAAPKDLELALKYWDALIFRSVPGTPEQLFLSARGKEAFDALHPSNGHDSEPLFERATISIEAGYKVKEREAARQAHESAHPQEVLPPPPNAIERELAKVNREIAKAENKGNIGRPRKQRVTIATDFPWQARLMLNADETGLLSNYFNAHLILQNDLALKGIFAFDEMIRDDVVTRPIPGTAEHAMGVFKPRPVGDSDILAVQRWLQEHGKLGTVYRNTVGDAIREIAAENNYHPLREQVKKLKWDATPRVDKWLSYYLGCTDTEYNRAVGRMFLVSMTARILDPGCQCDYMVILEGPQGILKSSVCRVLAGAEFFSDNVPDNLSNKDAAQHLRGKWIVEFAELHQFNKSDIDAIKKYVTRRIDQYRPPYARKEVIEERQVVFIGTTNRPVYLKDETGARRFWPVVVVKVDLDALQHDRDQLLAEALHLYSNGTTWWPSAEFEAKYILPEQEDRYDAHPWEQPIGRYLEGLHPFEPAQDPAVLIRRDRVTVQEIARNALWLTDASKVKTAESNTIIACLVRLGFRRGQRSGAERPWLRSVIPPVTDGGQK